MSDNGTAKKDPYGFPEDLKSLQARLHQARAEYQALCRALPWSVEPLPGWPGTVHPHTGEVSGGREPSPGYTPEQAAEEKRLWDLVRELSIAVSTHPYWSKPERGPELIAARMALKSHEDVMAAVTGVAEAA
ncbi:hypothetical protein ACFUAG_34570 [Streptomyces sp. NPDC057193]|uniref:hypothetical protein n=1 Tax=unclassified Streptomyces TaxID=2593676 RepID=UPI00093E8892|nr:hypothetical protein [Streptomyces sp. CB02261]OKJ52724.1 hypothetical protein AMK29_31525 [Streptomyces sp. CB02261]